MHYSNIRFHSEKELDEEIHYKEVAEQEKLGQPGSGKMVPQEAEKKE